MAVTATGSGALEFDALIKDSQFEATFRKIERQLHGLTDAAEKEGRAIENYAKKASQAVAAYFSFSTATSFISDIVRVRGEFQQLEVAFTTMLGSKEKSDKLLAQATDLAAKTPFTLQDVGAGAKQLLAYGFGAEEITSTLRRLGDVAAGVGAPLNDIVYLYGTTRTQGRLYAQDLMQFTSRGIPIIAELAKQFKVTEGEVKGLVEAGKVGFPEVEKVIKSLTSQGGLFFNLMEEQSKTLTGQISNLQDAWARMLNEIGKENQGVFSDAIGLATTLVENYQTVLDILKVLVITYGSYRAAMIATTAIMVIQQDVINGVTIAQSLQARATLISERAMKLLNATMLSNPYVAVTTGIVALVSALLIFGNTSGNVKSKVDLLNDAQEKMADSLAKQEAKIESYLELLKQGNLSEQQRIDLYNKLKEISPDIVKGLDAQSLSYDALRKNVDLYLEALRKQYALQANQEALEASIQQERLIEKQIKAAEKLQGLAAAQRGSGTNPNQFAPGLQGFAEQSERTNLESLRKQLEEQRKITKELAQEGAKEIKDTITEVKKDLQYYLKENNFISVFEEAMKLAANQADYKAIKKKLEDVKDSLNDKTQQALIDQYQAKIAIVEKSLANYSGKNKTKDEKETKKHLTELDKLREQIEDAERRARQSGMLKEESELDRINARYDELKEKAAKAKAEAKDFTRIENARQMELGSERIRNEVDQYKKGIDRMREIFNQFEDAKKEVGEENAKEMYADQLKGYKSFIQYLTLETLKFSLFRNTLLGGLTLQFLGTERTKEEAAQRKRQQEEDEARLKELLKSTESFKIREEQIKEKYRRLEQANEKRKNSAAYEDRKAALEKAKGEELQALHNEALHSSDVYKKLNEDIIGFSRQRIKKQIADIEAILKSGKTKDAFGNVVDITPEMEEAIKAFLERLKELYKETGKVADFARDFAEVGQKLSDISGAFHTLAFDVEGMNAGLADTLATLGDIVGIGASAANAIASFAKKDFIGGIASTAQAVVGIFSLGKKARESERQAAAEMVAFQDRILAGEMDINAQYRERERSQVSLNKLKLQGLRDEKKLLEEQKKAVEAQYNAVMARLQEQSYVVSQTTEKYGGFLGIGKKTRVNEVLGSLSGSSFEELEKLFNTGQLTDKAAELFQQLQKIKQEGVDIDALLARNAEQVKEAFTGTTSDSITDAILEGFKAGKKGAADFADDFEGLMQDAILQSLKFSALEGPLKDFYEQFAANAESDGILTEEEIRILRERFNAIVQNAGEKFDELQQITDIDLAGAGGGGGGGNSLSGAIKGISQQQADLLAGQFGGLRTTALDQLNVARAELTSLQAIQNHTANIELIYRLMQRVETNGLKLK